MENTDRDLGWEDVGVGGAQGGGQSASQVSGNMGSDFTSGLPVDAISSAMVSHFAREITQGGLSFWPQVVQTARRYFNVNHGYVLRKAVWQLVPVPAPKKKDGELSGEKDYRAH